MHTTTTTTLMTMTMLLCSGTTRRWRLLTTASAWMPPPSSSLRSSHFLRRNNRLWGAGRKRRSKSTDTTCLSWETFEYGDSPKWDNRFDIDDDDDDDNHGSASTTTTASVATPHPERSLEADAETEADDALARRLHRQADGWSAMDPDLVARATAVLQPYVRPERVRRIETVLRRRTRHVRFLFENPVNPSNVWACLRTLDAFGIQHVDVVVHSERYQGKAALQQKRGTRAASMGAARWLTVRQHGSTDEAVTWLRTHGDHQIWAADLSDRSRDIRHLDWTGRHEDDDDDDDKQKGDHDVPTIDDQRPICIVMGNEERGISDEMRRAVDGTFYLPMVGFAESFNLSVATAITAAHLSAASSSDGDEPSGPIRPGDLSDHEYNCLLLKGLLNSVAQKRMALALLKKEGIELPPAMKFV